MFQNGTDDWVPAETVEWMEFEPFSDGACSPDGAGAAAPSDEEACSPEAAGQKVAAVLPAPLGGPCLSSGAEPGAGEPALPDGPCATADVLQARSPAGGSRPASRSHTASPADAAGEAADADPSAAIAFFTAAAPTGAPTIAGPTAVALAAAAAATAHGADAEGDSMRSGDTEVLSGSDGEAAPPPAAPPIPAGEPPPPADDSSALAEGAPRPAPGGAALAPRRRSRHDAGGKRRSADNDENRPDNAGSPPPPQPSPPLPLLRGEDDFLASLPKSISGRRKRRTERMRRSISLLGVEGLHLSGELAGDGRPAVGIPGGEAAREALQAAEPPPAREAPPPIAPPAADRPALAPTPHQYPTRPHPPPNAPPPPPAASRDESLRRRSALFLKQAGQAGHPSGPGRGSAVAGLAARFERGDAEPANQLVDAIRSFDREARLHKVRRQSRRLSAPREQAAPPAADKVAKMLATALLQRRAHARLDDTMEREYTSD